MESVSAYIWRQAMERKFVLRGTVGNVSNELIGSFATYDEAIAAAKTAKDWRISNAISGETLLDEGWRKMPPMRVIATEYD